MFKETCKCIYSACTERRRDKETGKCKLERDDDASHRLHNNTSQR